MGAVRRYRRRSPHAPSPNRTCTFRYASGSPRDIASLRCTLSTHARSTCWSVSTAHSSGSGGLSSLCPASPCTRLSRAPTTTEAPPSRSSLTGLRSLPDSASGEQTRVPMFRSSSFEPLGATLYPWLLRVAGNEGSPSTECVCPHPPARNIKPCRFRQHLLPDSHPIRERCSAKYRGFCRVVRCLTIDSLVARPVEDGPRPVQFRPLCLFHLTGGTRSGFAAPFPPAPSAGEGHIFHGRKKTSEALSSL